MSYAVISLSTKAIETFPKIPCEKFGVDMMNGSN